MNSLSEQIKSAALNMGYEKCGIIKISDISGYEEKLTERIERIPETKIFIDSLTCRIHIHGQNPLLSV